VACNCEPDEAKTRGQETMPEGDTVFRTALQLHRALAGRRLVRIELRVPQWALTHANGASVSEVVSVGKHLLIRLSDDRTIHSHLRLDGAWRVGPVTERPRARGFDIRALLTNDTALAVGVRAHDIAVVSSANEAELVGHLGPDLMSSEFDINDAVQNFRAAPGRRLAEALLDQRLVAGIGNVYRSELLFLHNVNPAKPVEAVKDIEQVLQDARRLLRANSETFERSTTGRHRPGERLYVYGRRGRPCRRCGTSIVMITDPASRPGEQARVLYLCPRCQQ
jgi:endonuclease VIII